MNYGCCIRHLEELPQVKAAGYDFYEFAGHVVAEMDDATFDQLCALTRRLSFPCIGFNSYSSGIPAIVGDYFSIDATRAYAQILCERGHRLGIRGLGIGAPQARRLPPGFPRDQADEQCIAFLQTTCDIARDYGISVLLEAVNDRVCQYLNNTQDVVRLIPRVQRDNLRMVVDFYHMRVMGEPLSAIVQAAPYLAHVHVSTCAADLARGFPQMDEAQIYCDIFKALKAIGYDGTLSIEPNSFQPAAAAASLQMFQAIWG